MITDVSGGAVRRGPVNRRRQLTYGGQTYTIIGVGPRGFEYPRGVELWTALLPSVPNAVSDTAPGSIDLVARLRSDATMSQGRAELDRFLDGAYAKWRTSIGEFEATARTLPDVVVGSVKQLNMEIVTPGYFATLGVPLQQSRVFSRSDQRGAPPVVVVNGAMARAYWPGASAIGKRLRLGAATDTTAPRYTVVGIVGDMRYRELTTAMPSFYLPNAQFDRGAPTFFMVRTALDPAALISALRRTVSAVDSDASILASQLHKREPD